MSKNILFRADSSFSIGAGHIMRDLVLAKKYAKKGYNIIFATRNLKGNLNDLISKNKFIVEILEDNSFDRFY